LIYIGQVRDRQALLPGPWLDPEMYISYIRYMSEAASEMPISDARDRLADVVNRAVYAGTPTHLTRRGRRLAVVVSETYLAEEATRAREEATAMACRELWLGVKDAAEPTRAAVRVVIDKLMDAAEDASDLAAVDAAEAERQAGAQPVPWEQVKAELGL
jgi:prevent-host-death family protein